MSLTSILEKLSRKQLYSYINQLKRENNCLKTDLIRFELLSKSYEKYFHFFNEVNEKITSNEEILVLINKLKALKVSLKPCFVLLKPLKEIQLNQNCHQLSAEEVYDNESEVIDCDINQSNDKTNDESIDENTEQNYNKSEENFDSNEINDRTEETPKQMVLFEKIKTEDNSEMNSNELNNKSKESEETPQQRIGIKRTKIADSSQIMLLICYEPKDNSINYESEDINQGTDGIDFRFNQLNDGKIDRIVDENCETEKRHINRSIGEYRCSHEGCPYVVGSSTALRTHEAIHSNENNVRVEETPKQQILLKDIKSENNLEIISNESEIRIENIRSLRTKRQRKQKFNLISDEFEDTDIGYKSMDKSQDIDRNINPFENMRSHHQFLKTKPNDRLNSIASNDDEDTDIGFNSNDKSEDIDLYITDFNNKESTEGTASGSAAETFKCEWKDCTAVLYNQASLYNHMNRHKARYRCSHEGCQYIAGNLSNLKYHMAVHSEERHYNCGFDSCKQSFKSPNTLRNHQLAVHPQQFPTHPWLKCEKSDCHYKTKLMSVFNRHMRRHTRPFVCERCSATFGQSYFLKQHLKSFHSGSSWCRASGRSPNPKPCEGNGSKSLFNTTNQLQDDINVNTSQRTYSCSYSGCHKTFNSSRTLSIHTLGHKGKGLGLI